LARSCGDDGGEGIMDRRWRRGGGASDSDDEVDERGNREMALVALDTDWEVDGG
jgi:hypothetical protein